MANKPSELDDGVKNCTSRMMGKPDQEYSRKTRDVITNPQLRVTKTKTSVVFSARNERLFTVLSLYIPTVKRSRQ